MLTLTIYVHTRTARAEWGHGPRGRLSPETRPRPRKARLLSEAWSHVSRASRAGRAALMHVAATRTRRCLRCLRGLCGGVGPRDVLEEGAAILEGVRGGPQAHVLLLARPRVGEGVDLLA